MTNLLLFLILVALVGINIQLRKLLEQNDFTNEDASVKATAGRVKEAIDKLPKQQEN